MKARLHVFTKRDAVPLTGDNLCHRVTWTRADLASLPAGDVMVRIHLEKAEVFAPAIE